jgi:hypothetical protein
MLTVNAYGATSATEPLAPMTTERRDLGPHDVLVEVLLCQRRRIKALFEEAGPFIYSVTRTNFRRIEV